MPLVNGPVKICEYDPRWAREFEQLREVIWESVKDVALTVEHVGSTSVVGLAAKPIIDMDMVIESENLLPES